MMEVYFWISVEQLYNHIFLRLMNLNTVFVEKIIKTCCVLHKFVGTRDDIKHKLYLLLLFLENRYLFAHYSENENRANQEITK